MSKRVIGASICLFFSGLLIVCLYFFSVSYNSSENAFVRLVPPHAVSLLKILDIKYNSYYIAGCTSHSIYLGNYAIPTHILVSNYNLKDTQHLKIQIPEKVKLFERALTVIVDSPNFYMTSGNPPTILTGELSTLHSVSFSQEIPKFSSQVIYPISTSSFITRTYDKKLEQNILTKLYLDSNRISIKHAISVLSKQIDGVFCTDGMIYYDNSLSLLLYVYFYRNNFICLDTNLNIIYNGRTIDTNSVAKIKLAEIKSENKKTLFSPPLVINKFSCVSGAFLFINSTLNARNEDNSFFKTHSAIDVYSLKDGRYLYSFYLPEVGGKKIQSFRVIDKTLIAIQDRFLVTYALDIK